MNAHASILREFGLTADLSATSAPSPDDQDVQLMLARARGQARAEGYATGVENAETGFDREILLRLDAINAVLSALAARRAEDEIALAEACRNILVTFLDAVTPRLAEINVLPEIAAAIEDAVAATPGARIRIEAPPQLVDQIERVRDQFEADCEIIRAPDLNCAEARVMWEGGFDHIDTRPAIERACAILDARLRPAPPAAPPPGDEKDAEETVR